MMNYLIENNVLALRRTLSSEIDLILSLEASEENRSFIMPYDAQQHLQVIQSDTEVHLIIEDKITKSILGFIILSGLQAPDHVLELRRIVINSKGLGLGRQSLQLIKQYCFEVLHFQYLWLDVFDDNARAIHLYTSEGFLEDARKRKVIKVNDNYRSLLYFYINQV